MCHATAKKVLEGIQTGRGLVGHWCNLSIKQVATDLGIHPNVLSSWSQEQQREGLKAFRGQGVPRDEELAKQNGKYPEA